MKSTNDKSLESAEWNSAGKCRIEWNTEMQMKCGESLERKRSRINEEVDRKCGAWHYILSHSSTSIYF